MKQTTLALFGVAMLAYLTGYRGLALGLTAATLAAVAMLV